MPWVILLLFVTENLDVCMLFKKWKDFVYLYHGITDITFSSFCLDCKYFKYVSHQGCKAQVKRFRTLKKFVNRHGPICLRISGLWGSSVQLWLEGVFEVLAVFFFFPLWNWLLYWYWSKKADPINSVGFLYICFEKKVLCFLLL